MSIVFLRIHVRAKHEQFGNTADARYRGEDGPFSIHRVTRNAKCDHVITLGRLEIAFLNASPPEVLSDRGPVMISHDSLVHLICATEALGK